MVNVYVWSEDGAQLNLPALFTKQIEKANALNAERATDIGNPGLRDIAGRLLAG